MRLDPTVGLRTAGTPEEWAALEADAERFQVALGELDVLHRPVLDHLARERCDECGLTWPCPTATIVEEALA